MPTAAAVQDITRDQEKCCYLCSCYWFWCRQRHHSTIPFPPFRFVRKRARNSLLTPQYGSNDNDNESKISPKFVCFCWFALCLCTPTHTHSRTPLDVLLQKLSKNKFLLLLLLTAAYFLTLSVGLFRFIGSSEQHAGLRESLKRHFALLRLPSVP